MRYTIVVVLSLLIYSCREIEPLASSGTVEGYQIDGIVMTMNGIPVADVSVSLYYRYLRVRSTPLDTTVVMITDSTRIVYVAVYDHRNVYVRELFLGYRRPGPLPRFFWDERDDSGEFVPGGKYFVRYVYDTTIVKEVPWIADGRMTATTDDGGRFTIGNNRLPVDQLFDLYDGAGTYAGTYAILPEVDLELRAQNFYGQYSLTLQKNFITRRVFTIE